MMIQRMSWPRRGAVQLCTVLLAACGGGGSDSDVPAEQPRVALSATTEPRVSAEALESALGGQTNSALDALSSSPDAGPLKQAVQVGQQVAKRALQAAKASLQVTNSTTEPCSVSGSVTLTVTVANASAPLQTAGDGFSASFNACREAGGVAIGGGLRITVVSAAATLSVWDVQAIDLSVTLGSNVWRESGTTRITIDGSTAGVTKLTSSSARSSYTRSAGGQQRASYTVLNSTSTSIQDNNNGTVSTTAGFVVTGTFNGLGDGSFKVETLTPLQGPIDAAHPTSGSVRITGAGNGTVTLVVDASGVQVSADYNGDGVVDTTTTRTWAAIDALL